MTLATGRVEIHDPWAATVKYVFAILVARNTFSPKGVVNCQNSQDKGPPEGNSARG